MGVNEVETWVSIPMTCSLLWCAIGSAGSCCPSLPLSLSLDVIGELRLEDIGVGGLGRGGLVPPGMRGLVALAVKIPTLVLEPDRRKGKWCM